MPYEIRKENPFEIERICLSGYTYEDMPPLSNKYIKDGVKLIANVYFDTNLWDWDSSRNTCLALNGRDKIVVSRGDKGGELIRSTLSLTDRSWIFEGSECRSSNLKDNSYLKDKTFCDKSTLTRTSLSGCRCINSILTDVVATNCEFINCNIQGDTLYDKRWKGMVIKSKPREIKEKIEEEKKHYKQYRIAYGNDWISLNREIFTPKDQSNPLEEVKDHLRELKECYDISLGYDNHNSIQY